MVTVEDVRIALNEISKEELNDSTIQQKIEDAEHIASNKGIEGYNRTRFIRAYAALKSFIVSSTYARVNFGDATVQREWRTILDELQNEVDEVLQQEGLRRRLVITSTKMWDSREENPHY